MKAITAGGVFNSVFLLSVFFLFFVSIEKHFSYQWNSKRNKKNKIVVSEIHRSVGRMAKRYFKVSGAGLPLVPTLLGLSSTAAWTSSVLAELCVRNCFKKKKKNAPPLVQMNKGANLRRSQTKLWITARSHLDFSPAFCPWLVSSGLSGIQVSQGVLQVL